MRILYVSDAQSIHTRRWAQAFAATGAEVHVASFRPAQIDGVTVHRLPTAGLGRAGYLLAVPALRKLSARLCPDVVHAQYVTSYGFLSALARLKPLVVTAWGTDVLIAPQESRLSRWLAMRALAAADQVTMVAEHMRAAVAALGVPAAAIAALPFGVDTEVFHPPVAPRPSPPPLRVISTRNFGPVYSVQTVVDAVQRVLARGVDVRLDLVGAGPARAQLEARVQAAGLAQRTTFHGHVEPACLVALLGGAHVFVSSALSDGNNVSLNEAMACGCFPLATDIPANAQWIEHGRNGLLFPPGDDVALADAIVRAGDEPGWRAAAAADNRAIVEQRADWRMSVKQMAEIYERLRPGRARQAAGGPQ